MMKDLSENLSNEGIDNMNMFNKAIKEFFIFIYDLLKEENVN